MRDLWFGAGLLDRHSQCHWLGEEGIKERCATWKVQRRERDKEGERERKKEEEEEKKEAKKEGESEGVKEARRRETSERGQRQRARAEREAREKERLRGAKSSSFLVLRNALPGLPGGSVAKASLSQCRGPRFNP